MRTVCVTWFVRKVKYWILRRCHTSSYLYILKWISSVDRGAATAMCKTTAKTALAKKFIAVDRWHPCLSISRKHIVRYNRRTLQSKFWLLILIGSDTLRIHINKMILSIVRHMYSTSTTISRDAPESDPNQQTSWLFLFYPVCSTLLFLRKFVTFA